MFCTRYLSDNKMVFVKKDNHLLQISVYELYNDLTSSFTKVVFIYAHEN